MTIVASRSMTIAEFLDWEERQPARFEFDGLQPVEIEAASVEHSTIQINLLNTLAQGLRGSSYDPRAGDLKVIVPGRVRVPDVLVACAPLSPGATVIENPVAVFEIFSDGSQHCDLFAKLKEYLTAASIRHYVILEQKHAGAMIFTRTHDRWKCDVAHGLDGVLRLPLIGVEMRLSELYEGVLLAPEQDEDWSGMA